MDLPAEHKRGLVREVITTLTAQFTLVPLSVHAAAALAAHSRLVALEPHAPASWPPAELAATPGSTIPQTLN
jgi:hypothetical protein